MMRVRRSAVWVCAVFLAATFIAIGMSKLWGGAAIRWSGRFEHWGYPPHAQYVVGVLEIIGGVAMLIPRWRQVGAAILVVLMIGALCTHLLHGEFSRVVPPLVLGVLASLMYLSQRRR